MTRRMAVSPEADTSVTRSLQDKWDDLEDKERLAAMWMSLAGLEGLTALQANTEGYQADQRVAITLQALDYLARYMAGVPGRKNLGFLLRFPSRYSRPRKRRVASARLRNIVRRSSRRQRSHYKMLLVLFHFGAVNAKLSGHGYCTPPN